jgi:hypothetical protein
MAAIGGPCGYMRSYSQVVPMLHQKKFSSKPHEYFAPAVVVVVLLLLLALAKASFLAVILLAKVLRNQAMGLFRCKAGASN